MICDYNGYKDMNYKVTAFNNSVEATGDNLGWFYFRPSCLCASHISLS